MRTASGAASMHARSRCCIDKHTASCLRINACAASCAASTRARPAAPQQRAPDEGVHGIALLAVLPRCDGRQCATGIKARAQRPTQRTARVHAATAAVVVAATAAVGTHERSEVPPARRRRGTAAAATQRREVSRRARVAPAPIALLGAAAASVRLAAPPAAAAAVRGLAVGARRRRAAIGAAQVRRHVARCEGSGGRTGSAGSERGERCDRSVTSPAKARSTEMRQNTATAYSQAMFISQSIPRLT